MSNDIRVVLGAHEGESTIAAAKRWVRAMHTMAFKVDAVTKSLGRCSQQEMLREALGTLALDTGTVARKVHHGTRHAGRWQWSCSTYRVAQKQVTDDIEKVTCKACRGLLFGPEDEADANHG